MGDAGLTLNPGLEVLLAYSSPNIPSNVHAVGKKAKNEGCCQCESPVCICRGIRNRQYQIAPVPLFFF